MFNQDPKKRQFWKDKGPKERNNLIEKALNLGEEREGSQNLIYLMREINPYIVVYNDELFKWMQLIEKHKKEKAKEDLDDFLMDAHLRGEI